MENPRLSSPLVEPRPGAAYAEVPVTAPRAWPREEVRADPLIAGAGREWTVDEFLSATSTSAFVVVVDGVLVDERYYEDVTAEDRLLGNSATKSVLALLTGAAVRSGDLPDLDAGVTDFVPELTGTGYGAATVRQVLCMTTGVRWTEDYHDPDSPASRMLAGFREGTGGLRSAVGELGPDRTPGTSWAYCSPDSLVLDWVRERATGRSYAEALADLWQRTGAESPALVGLDAPAGAGGVAMAAGALAATARDWARLGQLQIDGAWGDDQVLPSTWVEETSRPRHGFTRPGRLPSTITTHAGFGYHWWPLDDEGTRVMADGMRGQFVYVDRPRRTVVVKLSAWPYDDPWWDRQCRDLSYLALPVIAASAAAAAGRDLPR